MTIKTLRLLAAVFSLGWCALAEAQSTTAYTAPAKWNNFYPASLYAPDDGAALSEALPLPTPDQAASGHAEQAPQPMDMSMLEEGGLAAGDGEAWAQADSVAPWSGATRLPLKPWFGSLNLLFLTQANDTVRPVAGGLGNFTTDAVNPDMTVGFDAEVGRYLRGGRFGIGVGYMLWNPQSESVTRYGAAGTITPAMPAYRDITINVNGFDDTVYNHAAGASGVRVRRDLFMQGIEANLYCFGLMGSQRVSRPGCNSAGCLGLGDRLCNGCYGFGALPDR